MQSVLSTSAAYGLPEQLAEKQQAGKGNSDVSIMNTFFVILKHVNIPGFPFLN